MAEEKCSLGGSALSWQPALPEYFNSL